MTAADWLYWDQRYRTHATAQAETVLYEQIKLAPHYHLRLLGNFLALGEYLCDADIAGIVSRTTVTAMSHMKVGDLPGSLSGEPGVKVRSGNQWGFLEELQPYGHVSSGYQAKIACRSKASTHCSQL